MITPKNQASKLFSRFYDPYVTQTGVKNAKRCAAICIDEIMVALESWQVEPMLAYWTEVKLEIERL